MSEVTICLGRGAFFAKLQARMKSSTRPVSESPTPVDASAWFTAGRFASLLGVLILVAFPEVATGRRTFVFGDFGLFGYPLAYYHRQSFWRGEVPLWNPLNDCGLPFLAQWNTLTCYPLSLIYLLLPMPWSLGLYDLCHLFLAGLGMYFLANSCTANRFGATVAGITFCFSGLALNCLVWPNNIAALGWMPWVVLCVDRAARLGGRNTVIAAVVGAFQMLAGAPEVTVFTWTIALLFCLSQRQWPAAPPKRILTRFAMVAAMVAGLTALQLLPFLDLLSHSHRDTGQANMESPMPLTGWANYLVPLFHCYKSPPGLFFQPDQWWTYSYYLSEGVLAAAACSVWLARERRVWLLAGLTGLCLVSALGDQAYLYAWLRRLFPPLNFVNFPIKYVVVVTFCVPLLGAFAVREWHSRRGLDTLRVFRSAILVGIIAICAMVAILWSAHQFPKVYERWPNIWRNAATRGVFLALTLGTFYAIARFKARRHQVVLSLFALGLIWLDGLTHVPNLNPTVPPAVLEPGLPNIQRLVPLPRHGESRIMLSAPAAKRFRTALLPDVANTYLGHRLGLYFNCNLLENMPKAGGFYSLYLREQLEVMFALYAPSDGIASALADFMSVSQITSPTNMLEWAARTNYLPMATAGQMPVFTDSTNSLIRLLDPDFDPREAVFLPEAAKPFLRDTRRTQARIIKSHFSAHHVGLEVEAPETSLVVLSQTVYHLWRAEVDGRPARLWRANHAFQALEVPAGNHHVKLVYRDDLFRLGALISCLSLALICRLPWLLQGGSPPRNEP